MGVCEQALTSHSRLCAIDASATLLKSCSAGRAATSILLPKMQCSELLVAGTATETICHLQRMTFNDGNPFEAINARIEASLGDERDGGRPRSPRPVRKCSIRARALLEAVSRAPGLHSEDGDGAQRAQADLPRAADAAAPSGGVTAGEPPAAEGSTEPPQGVLVESWVPKQGSRAGRLDIFRVTSIQPTP